MKVRAAGAIAGTVTALGKISIYAGDVTANVTSDTGSVEIFAEGIFSGTAHATAGGVVVCAVGNVTGSIDAPGEIWVWSGGDIAANSLPNRTDGVFVWSAGAAVPPTPPPAPAKLEFFDLTSAFALGHLPAPLPTGAEDTMPVADAPKTIALFVPISEKDTWRRMVSGVKFVEDPRFFAQGSVRVVMPLSSRNDLVHNHVAKTLATVYQLQGEDLRVALGAVYGGHLNAGLLKASNGDMHDGSRVLTLVSGANDPVKKAVTVGISFFGLPAAGMTQQQIDAEIARRKPFIDQANAQLKQMRKDREYPGGRGPAPDYRTHKPAAPDELRLETKVRRMYDPIHWDITSSGEVVPRGPLAGGLPVNMLALEADLERNMQDRKGGRAYRTFTRVFAEIRSDYERIGRREAQLRQIGEDYRQYLTDYQAGERLYARMLATPALRAEVMPQLKQFMQEQRTGFEATLAGLTPAEQQKRKDSVSWLYGDPENLSDSAFRLYRPMVGWTDDGKAYFSFMSTPTLRNLVLEQALAAQSSVVGNLTDGYYLRVAPVLYVPGIEDEIAFWYAKYGTTAPETIVNKNVVETAERPLISDSTPLIILASAGTAAGIAYGQGATILGTARAAGVDTAINISFITISEAVTEHTKSPTTGFVAGAAAVIGAIGARKAIVSAAFRREIVYFLKSETGQWFVTSDTRIVHNALVNMGVVNTGNHPVWKDLAVLDGAPVLGRTVQQTEEAIRNVFRRHVADFDAKLAGLDATKRARVERDLTTLAERFQETQTALVQRLKADTGARDGEIERHLGVGKPITEGQLTEANAFDALNPGAVANGKSVSIEVGGQGAGGCDVVVREAKPELNAVGGTGKNKDLPSAQGLGKTGDVLLRREVKSLVTDNTNTFGNDLADALDQVWKWSRNDANSTQLEVFIQVRSDKAWTAQKVQTTINDFVNAVRGRLMVNRTNADALLLREQMARANKVKVVDEKGAVLFEGPLPSISLPPLP